jgi:hypothetical protein
MFVTADNVAARDISERHVDMGSRHVRSSCSSIARSGRRAYEFVCSIINIGRLSGGMITPSLVTVRRVTPRYMNS